MNPVLPFNRTPSTTYRPRAGSPFRSGHLMSKQEPKSPVYWNAVVPMIVSVGFFALSDVAGKELSNSYPTFQILFLRTLLVLALAGAVTLYGRDTKQLTVHAACWLLLRSVVWSLTALFFVLAFSKGPMLPVYLVTFLHAGMVPLLGWAIYRKKLILQSFPALVLMFLGVVVTLFGGTWTAAPEAILFGFLAGFFYALTAVLTDSAKAACGHSSSALLFYTALPALVLFAAGIAIAPWFGMAGWMPPAADDLAWIGCQGLAAGVANLFLISALFRGPAATIMPWDYSIVFFGALFDWGLYGELLTLRLLIGTVIIVVGGVWLTHTADTSV